MTPEQLKELAEWSRKFLADNTCYVLSSGIAENCLFHKWDIAPILMQLGKREIRQTHFIQYQDDTGPDLAIVHKWNLIPKAPPFVNDAGAENENEYIAFWSAIMQAIKGEALK